MELEKKKRKKKKDKLRFMVFIAPYPASEYFPMSMKEIMVMAYCLSISTLWTLLVCFEFYVIVLATFHTFSSLHIKVQSVRQCFKGKHYH